MTTVGVVRGLAGAEPPMIGGDLGWAVVVGTVLVWALIAFVAYLVIRSAVRHALQDVARESETARRPGHVDAG